MQNLSYFHHNLKPFLSLCLFPPLSSLIKRKVPFLHKTVYYEAVLISLIRIYNPLYLNLVSTLTTQSKLLSAKPPVSFMSLNSMNFCSVFISNLLCICHWFLLLYFKAFVSKAGILNRVKFNYFETFGAVLEYNAVFFFFSYNLTLLLYSPTNLNLKLSNPQKTFKNSEQNTHISFTLILQLLIFCQIWSVWICFSL